MLANSIDLQLQRGVVSALPMQDHLNKAAFDTHDNLVQCGAQDPFARFYRRSRMRPGELQIGPEPHQMLPLVLAQGRRLLRLELGNLTLEPMHDLQRLVPATLQLARHQTIGGIDRIILPASMCRREVRLLKRQIELPLCGRDLARLSRERFDCGIDAERLQHPQHFCADGIIGTQAAEGRTRVSSWTIALPPSPGARCNRSRRAVSTSLICCLMKLRRAMSRRSSARVFGGRATPSGVRTVSRRCDALRNIGLKLRMPRRANAPFILLTMRVRSLTRLSRSRPGRFASSSVSVGIAAILQ